MRVLGVALLAASTLSLLQAQAAAQRAATPRLSDMQRAVEEFKIQTRNLGLRADSPPGARAKKNGATRWHGRIFENFRNDILDAIPHEIRQRDSKKSLLRRNQFGFNLAGPLFSRSTFLSVSYEGMRERISRAFLRTVPILPERMGDFSSTVDLSGQPLNVFDPASTRPNPAYDTSQPVSASNLQYARDPFPDNRIPATRMDPVALGALTHYPEPNTSVGPYFRNNYFVTSPESNTANGMIVKLDRNVNARNRLETSASFSNGFAGSARVFPTAADANTPDRRFSSRQASAQHSYIASPRTLFTGEIELSSDKSQNESDLFPAYRFGDSYAPMGRSGPNSRNVRNNYWLNLGASTRRSKHSIRGSASIYHQQAHVYAPQFPAGNFRFTPGLTSLPGINNTGHSFSSYLLGLSDYAETSVVSSPSYFRRNRMTLSVRDTYEMERHLTMTGGLTLEVAKPRTEKYDRQSTIDLGATNPANGLPGALVSAGRNGYGRAFQPVRARLEPSAGIAWNPMGDAKTVLRASYSRSYQGIGFGSGQFGTQGFNAYPTFLSPNVQLSPAVVLREGLPDIGQTVPDLRLDAVNDMIADLVDMSAGQPRIQIYGLSLERQTAGALVVTTGFYHYDGKNMLVGSASADLNAIPLEYLRYRDLLNDESFRRDLRPYPQYRGFDLNSQYPLGRYERDAGYLRLEKRTSGGLGLSAYYEFSKQMDDYSGPYGTQDFYNRDNEWARTAGSNPHRVTLSYTYDLPIGPGNSLFGYSDWRRYFVEGWAISGMTTVSSGDPLSLHPQFNNTGGVISTLNVNVVPGIEPSVPDPGPDMWFNPAAFVQPPDFTVGNASRTHPSLLGPGSQNHDLSVTKRFSLTADRSMEFSAVGFNFINHANWNDPDIIIGTEDAPNVNAGRIIGSRGGRVVQLGLRYSF